MGVFLELSRLVGRRWDFQQADLDRLWNLCVILFVSAALYVFAAGEGGEVFGELFQAQTYGARSATLNQGARVVLRLFQWAPLTLFPMALAQSWHAQSGMDLSTFSWWLRRRRLIVTNPLRLPTQLLNIGYVYFGVCLFSASAGQPKSLWSIAGLVGLICWALWSRRPQGFSVQAWGGAVACSVFLGLVLQSGLAQLQQALQQLDAALMSRFSGGPAVNFKESRTSLGSIGRLKLSGKILWRLNAGKGSPPALIREASYNLFRSPVWGATERDFDDTLPEADQQSWILDPSPSELHSITMAGRLYDGKGLLPLPLGTARLKGLGGFLLQTNTLGMVRSEEGPGFVRYEAQFNTSHSLDRAPNIDDLHVPEEERRGLKSVAASLGLPKAKARDSLDVVQKFFADGFQYSVWRGLEHLPTAERTSLERFLTEHRSGHCEYFATATALLLRQAGIPTRYAVGYSVQESKGGYNVVRERHAHAWCLAWIDDRWREVDTTPGIWVSAESERASPWEPVRDFFSRIAFEFSKWRWGDSEWKRYTAWLIAPFLVLAILRLIMTKPWRHARQTRKKQFQTPAWPGLDSEFYLIEKLLCAEGLERRQDESIATWLKNIHFDVQGEQTALERVVELHYRLRFDPRGLRPHDRTSLDRLARHWLEHYRRDNAAKTHRRHAASPPP